MPEENKKESTLSQKIRAFFGTRIPFAQKIFFLDHLRTMVHAGLSIVESLDILAKQMEHKGFKKIILSIKEDVEKGSPLSEVLAKYPSVFPDIYISMIESGEVSGKLEETLSQIVTQMKKSYELRNSIRGAMIYPAIIFTAMGGIALFMAIFVIPKMLEIFREFDAKLPLPTRVLIAVTDALRNPIIVTITLAIIITIIISFSTAMKRSYPFRRGVHAALLRLPIIGGVMKQINLAQFSMTLSSLLQSTVPIISALESTGRTCGNLLYRESLAAAAEAMKSGEQLSEILRLHPRLYPPMVTEMIMVGERTGQVDHLLEELSTFYGKEVDHTMKNFSTIIEPIIILMLGVGVAGLAIAVVMPTFSLVQNF